MHFLALIELFSWTMRLKGSVSLTSGGIGTQSERLKQLLLQLQEELVQGRQAVARTNLASLFPPLSPPTREGSSVLIVPLEDA